MNLIIVESPTKARTLSKFLGSEYKIEASMGHIRDLPTSKMGIEIKRLSDEDIKFEPTYVQTEKQKIRTKEIKRLSDEAKNVYFATDPDREGEAISWHVAELLKAKKPKRIAFHEITKSAIEEALQSPREIDMDLVNAQQARRILDRLVGYKLSPLLWRKVRRGLSAGRVQSVAVRLIVEREREIEAFKPVEYWDIQVVLQLTSLPVDQFTVKLVAEIKNQQQAEKIAGELLNAEYRILNIEKKEFKRTPPAPFTTSTLQQTAANKFGWSAKKTMQAAQRLYEQGFITYHRTDSTNIADEASTQCAVFITQKFGKEYALEKPRIYKTKSKVAQEAHEAIRPTNMAQELQVDRDEQKLYDLIWKRFVACQMAEVAGVTVRVTVRGGDYKLEAKGETINFLGWYKVMEREETGDILPEVKEGEVLSFVSLEKLQKFTQGPARYNDASLIKTLEELGIGRPSTYAPTIATIEERHYVEKFEKRFKPTAIGIAVCDFLQTHFPEIVDYQFTANMEDALDEIANGKLAWQKTLHEFYDPFAKKLDEVQDTAERVKIETEETGDKCPKCSDGDVIIRTGKFGKFLACSRYPECDYKANFQNKIGVKCTKCSDGDIILRRTKSGRNFFGCSNYPKCDFASWTKPENKVQ